MKIFYFCPSPDKATGGVKQIFRHVEALRAADLDAYVLQETNERPAWFDSSAPIADITNRQGILAAILPHRKSAPLAWMHGTRPPVVNLHDAFGQQPYLHTLSPYDYLLLPEFLGFHLHKPKWQIRLGIFNQNAHYTFNFWSVESFSPLNKGIYDHIDFILCVSDHSLEYLNHTFPTVPIFKAINGVDIARFTPGNIRNRWIAYMPRKLAQDAIQLFGILNFRNVLTDWKIIPIEDKNEKEVAEILSRSRIFVSTCSAEGFGLPPLEAAAAGCSVVGYTGYAAREFMLPELCMPISQGDVLGLAKATESVILDHFRLDASEIPLNATQHMAFVRNRFSQLEEARSIVSAWEGIFACHQRAAPDRGP